jgi:hypothetical protein
MTLRHDKGCKRKETRLPLGVWWRSWRNDDRRQYTTWMGRHTGHTSYLRSVGLEITWSTTCRVIFAIMYCAGLATNELPTPELAPTLERARTHRLICNRIDTLPGSKPHLENPSTAEYNWATEESIIHSRLQVRAHRQRHRPLRLVWCSSNEILRVRQSKSFRMSYREPL